MCWCSSVICVELTIDSAAAAIAAAAALGSGSAVFEGYLEGGRVTKLDKQVQRCVHHAVRSYCCCCSCCYADPASHLVALMLRLVYWLLLQIHGVMHCLKELGPWCAAAAAYVYLLAPSCDTQADEEEAQAAAAVGAEDLNVRRCSSEESSSNGTDILAGLLDDSSSDDIEQEVDEDDDDSMHGAELYTAFLVWLTAVCSNCLSLLMHRVSQLSLHR